MRRIVLVCIRVRTSVLFTNVKVQAWVEEVRTLAKFAESQLHAAFAALTHGLVSKWNYLSRTTFDISGLLQPLEDSIRSTLIPKLMGRETPKVLERNLLALPARHGGMGIGNPVTSAPDQYQASIEVTKPLVYRILSQEPTYPFEVLEDQITAKSVT